MKKNIAGKYSAQALFHRISRSILDSETPMAVLVLEMIDSKFIKITGTYSHQNGFEFVQ